jgi:hypothetical protein
MRRKGVIVLVAAVLLFFIYKVATRPSGVVTNEKISSAEEPFQEELESDISPISFQSGGFQWKITPKAEYQIAARVLRTESYWTGWQSSLSPVDFALGWADLAQEDVDQWISWSQNNRWYFFQWEEGSPYRNDYIISHSANIHIIPANKNIESAALQIDRNDQVLLEGLLVDVDGEKTGENHWWRSSTSRNDTGDGSCELLYLQRVVVDGKEYR